MTEMREFKDFLKSVITSYLMKETKKYIESLKEYRVDPVTKGYRSPADNKKITDAIETKVDEFSEDFVDELEAKNLSTPSDYENNVVVLQNIIENYTKKYSKWLNQQ